jgi:hypothetical protein
MFVTRFISLFSFKKTLNFAIFVLFNLFSGFIFAQKSIEFSEKVTLISNLPVVSSFPNPAMIGDEMTIQLHFETASITENTTYSLRVSDESGRVILESILPDEFEFSVSADRFDAGLYYVQFFENGHLFETDELWIK